MKHKDIFCHDRYKCSCGFTTTSEVNYQRHQTEVADTQVETTPAKETGEPLVLE